MYTADVEVRADRVRPLILAAAKLEMQGMVNAILKHIMDWELSNLPGGPDCNTECGVKKMIKERERHSPKKRRPPGIGCRRKERQCDSDSFDTDSQVCESQSYIVDRALFHEHNMDKTL